MDEDRITKLPKWAQSQIHRLQKDVEWYKKQMRQVVNEENTPIRWELLGTTGGIPSRAYVLFDLDSGTIEATIRDGILVLRTQTKGCPVVQSKAANVIRVKLDEYWF